MRLIRIGTAAVSVKVGDFTGNLGRLREVITAAKSDGVHLLVTPELCLSGYSLEDRILWPDIARRSWTALHELAEHCRDISVWIGLPVQHRSMMYNAAALIHDGRVRGMVLKRFLPTYSIFYEGRNWAAWDAGVDEINGVPAGDLVFQLPFGLVSAEICEDMWAPEPPARERVLAGAEVICNCSASPFTPLKQATRIRRVQQAAENYACVYAYANLLGLDNSRIVFDGGGLVVTPEGVQAEGELLAKAPWTLTHSVVDLDEVKRFRSENTTWREYATEPAEHAEAEVIDASDGSFIPASVSDYARQLPATFFGASGTGRDAATQYFDELFDALVLGLRDYFEKSGVFRRYLVALSGGRDSALCLVLAVHAVRAFNGGKGADVAEHIEAVYLPSDAHSSTDTRRAAEALASELGVPFRVVSIEDETRIATEKAEELMDGLGAVTDLARQNIQSRVRGTMMLNWANSAGGLVLVTANLSEAAVGYTTTGGDNQGGLSPIANVPKTLVSRLLEHVAKRDGLASIANVLAIPPSAELAPDQTDEVDLMPYAVLDDLLYLFARRRLALPDCWRIVVERHPDHDAEQLREWTAKFGKLFAFNQWKREQLPVSLKVLDLDLDPKTGFRFPVTQSIESELAELEAARL